MKIGPSKLMERSDLKREVGVVDQNIDAAKLAFCCLHHPRYALASGRVGLKDNPASAARFDLIENLLRRGFVLVIIHDYRGTALREANRRRRTNAPARTGHQSGFSA